MIARQVRELARVPDLLGLHAADPAYFPALLEGRGDADERYAILMLDPGTELALDRAPPRPALHRLLGRLQLDADADRLPLPFSSGYLLMVGYEFAAAIESRLRLPRPPAAFPDFYALRIHGALVVDQFEQRAWLVQEHGRPSALPRLEAKPTGYPTEALSLRLAAEDGHAFERQVDTARDYLRAGDVFQVNLARRWSGGAEHLDPVQLYHRLRQTNPAPQAALVRRGRSAIISSSPERLVALRQGRLQTRPIAGTRPRTPGSDEAMRAELKHNPKERAEHLMLVDLERNDLGRVAQTGTVRVAELMEVHSYARVHHLESRVEARLREDCDWRDVLYAMFPGGTISGCPKVRALELIAELEGRGRGPYTGSLGYLDLSGDMDLNILIRSFVHDGQTLSAFAGAGIVIDSDPERERLETEAKIAALLAAAGAGP